ncbi:terminase large subunit [Salmonella phage 21]|nr:terminase large subunit [Salmonella phage 21]
MSKTQEGNAVSPKQKMILENNASNPATLLGVRRGHGKS